MVQPFKILSLSGGGIRGIYQAAFLKEISNYLPEKPFYKNFDLICGTSTGAIIAMAIALDIDIGLIEKLYNEKGNLIFSPKFFRGLSRGGVYNSKALKNELEQTFKNTRLSDCHTKIMLTACSLTQSEFKIFKNFNEDQYSNISTVEAVLSSAAAPTYFDPVQLSFDGRAYVDGGLWANSPAGPGLFYSLNMLGIHKEDIRLISVGTGIYKQIETFQKFRRRRKWSIDTIRKIIDLFFTTQESYDSHFVKETLHRDQFVQINTHLSEYIELDDVKKAKSLLPQIAKDAADKNKIDILKLLSDNSHNIKPFIRVPKPDDLITDYLKYESGLSGFYPSRDYYYLRQKDGSLASYVSTITHNITFVSISLSNSLVMQNVLKVLKEKLETSNFVVTISLLNPYLPYLVQSIASVLARDPNSQKAEIIASARRLLDFKRTIPESKRSNLRLRFHNAIPFGSAIIIDDGKEGAKLQVETRGYQTGERDSFAMEIIPSKQDGLYETLRDSFRKLVDDGNDMQDLTRKETRVANAQSKQKGINS